jgi:hypothetical protein
MKYLKKDFPDDWKNGLQHNIPFAFPGFNLAKYVNVSPSIGYNEKWYFKKYNYTYVEGETFYDEFGRPSNIDRDTITGLSRVYDYSYSLSTSTNIYGMFMPRNPNSRIKGIRHKLTPSASFSYRPDFGENDLVTGRRYKLTQQVNGIFSMLMKVVFMVDRPAGEHRGQLVFQSIITSK